MKQLSFVVFVAAAAVASAGAATTKDFKPGDARLCGATRCVAVMSPTLTKELSSFVYAGPQPRTAAAVRVGEPAFELRFRDGYVAGILATGRLDRWLSYGVYLERFSRGRWYIVPRKTAAALQRLAAPLKPLRLTPAAIARSR